MKIYQTYVYQVVKVALEGSYSEKDWVELCSQYENRCVCCGEKRPLAADHVLPVSKGGKNYIENIQPLCQECNSRKCDRAIDYRKSPFRQSGETLPVKEYCDVSRSAKDLMQITENANLWLSIPEASRPKIKRSSISKRAMFIYKEKRYDVPESMLEKQ